MMHNKFNFEVLCLDPLLNFRLIQFSVIPGMKPLSCPSEFICDNKGLSISSRKSYLCSTMRLCVSAAATVYQDLTSGQD